MRYTEEERKQPLTPEQRALVERHMGMAEQIAKSFKRKMPSHHEDMIGAAQKGLVEAAGRFGGQESEFEAFAFLRMKGAVIDYLRKQDPAGKSGRGLIRKAEAMVLASTTEGQAALSFDDALRAIVKDGPNGRNRMDAVRNARHGVLPLENGSQGVGYYPTLNAPPALTADAISTPETQAEQSEMRLKIAEAMMTLSPREQEVVDLYHVQEMSLKVIGEKLGVTETRICQIHKEAMRKIRKAVDEPKGFLLR